MAATMKSAVRTAILIALSFVVACDLSLENERLGVTRDTPGQVRILYLGCSDERISTIELVDVRGAVGGSDDLLVWGVEAVPPVRHVDVTLGEASGGFHETKALTTELEGEYTVILDAGLEGEVLQGVNVDALEPGLVDTGAEEPLPVQEFEQEASGSCG